ncbi:MAG: hypothetical protein CME70_06185 [Halobacteriovorax sp.]|nr:hypothetical protein [Halobacteriovorax sp.]
MSASLYHEAIAEAKQLKEMAERNAKNRIIDAVTPKIRRMIERELLGEDSSEESGESEDLELDDLGLSDDTETLASPEGPAGTDSPTDGTGDTEMMTINLDDLSSTDALDPDMSGLDDSGVQLDADETGPSLTVPVGADVDVQVSSDGGVNVDTSKVNIDLATSDEESAEDDGEEDLLLDEPIAEALALLLRKREQTSQRVVLEKKIYKLGNKVSNFKRIIEAFEGRKLSSSQREIMRNYYIKLLKEVGSLKGHVIFSEGESSSSRLRQRAIAIIKEMKIMSNSRNSKFARLFESDRLELAELDAVLTLTPEEDEAETVEDVLADLDIDLEIEEPSEEEGGDEEAEVGEEAPEEEGGDDDFDLGEGMYEFDEVDEVDEVDESDVVEIDEAMLRSELRRMKKLKETSRTRRRHIREETSGVDDPSQTADAFGGGDVDDEAFVDVDEDTLLNALADELGSVTAASGSAAAAVAETRRRRRNRTNESRTNRALKKKLAEYAKAVKTLRSQLSEMNLFNAKLLYANKLMQNRNITAKQQRQVVQALDEAKTLREAKLLYKSLTSSLQRRSASTLKESRIRTSGSSSRSTRSAAPAKSGVEADNRWQVLAGIKK